MQANEAEAVPAGASGGDSGAGPAAVANRGVAGVPGGEGEGIVTAQAHMAQIATKRSLDDLMATNPATLAPTSIDDIVGYARNERATWYQAERDRDDRRIEKEKKKEAKGEAAASKRKQELAGMLDAPMEGL